MLRAFCGPPPLAPAGFGAPPRLNHTPSTGAWRRPTATRAVRPPSSRFRPASPSGSLGPARSSPGKWVFVLATGAANGMAQPAARHSQSAAFLQHLGSLAIRQARILVQFRGQPHTARGPNRDAGLPTACKVWRGCQPCTRRPHRRQRPTWTRKWMCATRRDASVLSHSFVA